MGAVLAASTFGDAEPLITWLLWRQDLFILKVHFPLGDIICWAIFTSFYGSCFPIPFQPIVLASIDEPCLNQILHWELKTILTAFNHTF